jgi:hypothetical protein
MGHIYADAEEPKALAKDRAHWLAVTKLKKETDA